LKKELLQSNSLFSFKLKNQKAFEGIKQFIQGKYQPTINKSIRP
jgi:hypothetical protein